jgi:von Willebrand factor type A domain
MRFRNVVPLIVVLLAVIISSQFSSRGSFGSTASAQDASPSPNTSNVEFVIDSSGSMDEEIEPGTTRMAAAKDVMTEVIDSLPEQPGVNVGLRVYGHKGSNTEAGRSESCRSTELKVPVSGVDKPKLQQEVDALQPVGWTPLALSLKSAEGDFPVTADGIENSIVLVTDGLETCYGNPCVESKNLKNGPGAVVTHVIGFALSEGERENLQCIVDESGGLLLGADNAEELNAALFEILNEIDVVPATGSLEIESIGGVFPKATITGPLTDASASTDQSATTIQISDSNTVELAVGRYHVSWANPSGQMTTLDVQVDPDQRTVIRGSILRLPQGSGEVYRLTSLDGTTIWLDSIESGDAVWLLPGTYRLRLEEVGGTAPLISLDVQTIAGAVTYVDISTAP